MVSKKASRILCLGKCPEKSFLAALKKEGLDLQHFEDLESAIEAFGEGIDAIILSEVNPQDEAFKLLDRIRDQMARVPVVIVGEKNQEISLPDAYDRGAEAVFWVPVDPKGMIDTIRRHLAPKEIFWSRRFERLPVQMKTHLNCHTSRLEQNGQTVNLGRGGMFLACGTPSPKIGETVQFGITSPSGEKIEGTGIVRWVRAVQENTHPPGIGIEFLDLPKKSSQIVYEIVNAIKTNKFIPKS